MKRYLLFGLTLILIFSFTFALSLQVLAFDNNLNDEPTDPDQPITGYICCTYTNWCGGVGYGSWVPVLMYGPDGKPYWGQECRYLTPGQPYYNFKCRYEPAPSCNCE